MKRLLFACTASAALTLCASWYWPFSSDSGDDGDKEPPRMSTLMEKASVAIDEANDLAAEGKTDAAVEKYRAALDELSRLERENPERAETQEFASVRTKRAYVNAAIDAILLEKARENAKAVAVTDTTDLEKRFAAKRAAMKKDVRKAESKNQDVVPAAKTETKPKMESQLKTYMAGEKKRGKEISREAKKARQKRTAAERARAILEKEPANRKARLVLAGEDARKGDFEAARLTLAELLKEKPNDASALNLLAVVEAASGNPETAEKRLDQCIMSNPRDWRAYYNMANLLVQSRADKGGAKRYYDAGRELGGPKDSVLEEKVR